MTPGTAAILLKLCDSWLILVDRHASTPPGDAVRAALRALALEAPDAAATCPALMAFTRVTPGITHFGTSPSHDADSDTTELVPVGEAARRLGVRPHAVRAAARRGSLPAIKDDSGCWLIRQRDVEKRAWTRHRSINLNPVRPEQGAAT